MSARRIAVAALLALLASSAWAQQHKQGAVMQPMVLRPDVDLVSPVDGAQFVTGQTVTLDAVGYPMNGEIQQVAVYLDGVLYASTTTSDEVSANWTATLGTHTVYAKATDEALSRTSPTITITVVPNIMPAVTLTAPANNAAYTIGASVPMTATASDSDGSISRVEFYVDGSKKGQDTSSPYAYTWAATAGNHSVLAKAIDNANGTTSTAAITIHGVPAVPTLTLPTTSTTGSYTASWTTSTGATHYELTEKVGSGTWSTPIQDTSATSKAISGKAPGSYSYRVRACADAGTANCSAYSATKTVTVNPAVPTLTLPATSANGSYTASWTTSTGATHYELTEKVGSGSWSAPIQDTSATSWAASGKAVGSYSYRVRACAGTGTVNCSAYSATKTVTVNPAVPTLTLPATSADGSYTANWTTSTGATHYELTEKVGSGSWSAPIQDTSATSWAASGKADGSYSYRVRACAGTGTVNCSAYSATTTVTVTSIIRPEVPTLTLPVADPDGSYDVKWSSSDDPEGYELDEQVGNGTWNIGVYVGSGLIKQYTGRAPEVYGYRVRACNGEVCSDYASATITVLGVPVIAPLSSPNASGEYTVTWSTVPGTPWYRIYESTDGGATWSGFLQNSPETSMDFTGKADGTYSYKVRACKGQVCGNYSAVVSVTVSTGGAPPDVPTLTLSATTSNTGTYDVNWSASTGATHYELAEQIGTGLWTPTDVGNTTTAHISGKANGTYSYKVRACASNDTSNCSDYSTPETVTVALTAAPAAPVLTLPATSDTGSYDASWTTSSGATHYELGEQAGSGDWFTIQDTGATSLSLSGKSSGSYNYRVRACTGVDGDTGNCSDYSNTGTIVVTVPIPPPTRTYTYNSNQELCRVEEPETGVTLMGYDAAGNLAWSASGLPSGTACSSSGNTTAINARKAARTYDARNRVSTLEFPDHNGDQDWTYTPDGLPASVTTFNDALASSVTNVYAYNERRLLTEEQQQTASTTLTVDYDYDENGFLSAMTYPDALPAGNRTIAFAPNALGQPTQAGSYATDVTYYPNGAIAGFMYGNGIKHEMTQNARGLPAVSWDHNGPTTAVLQDEYTYDQVGNVVAIIDAAPSRNQHGNREMYYDDLNRLTRVVATAMFGTATYAYDAYDNLTHVAVSGGSKIRDQDYAYDEHNRLTNVMDETGTVIGLGYDVQGNLANKNGTLFTFDYGNRLRAVGTASAELENYAYDAQGRRIRSSSSLGQIDSLYSQSGQLLFQKDGRGSKRRQYVYLGGSLVAEVDLPLTGSTATVAYQHTDALGTPVAITNSSKTVIERREYEPYGYQTTPTLQDGPNYTGHVADAATGMIYMQQRYYDPLCGCFLSVDPATAYSPGGAFNQYWYANANPYGLVDPDGRDGKPAPGCGKNGWCRRARHEENQRRGNAPYTWGSGGVIGRYTGQKNSAKAPAGSSAYGPYKSGYVFPPYQAKGSSDAGAAQAGAKFSLTGFDDFEIGGAAAWGSGLSLLHSFGSGSTKGGVIVIGRGANASADFTIARLSYRVPGGDPGSVTASSGFDVDLHDYVGGSLEFSGDNNGWDLTFKLGVGVGAMWKGVAVDTDFGN